MSSAENVVAVAIFLVCARVSRAIGSSQGTIGIGSLRSGSLSNMPRDIENWANTRLCNRQ